MLFSGIRYLRSLSQQQQEVCEGRFRDYLNYSLTPLLLEIGMLVNWCVALLFFLMLLSNGAREEARHQLIIYLILVFCFFCILRLTGLRRRSPYSVYLFFIFLCFWSLWVYIHSQGNQAHLHALVFTLAFMGGVTISIKHTFSLWLIFLVFVCVASLQVNTQDSGVKEAIKIISHGWIILCFVVSLVTALVARILFRNLFSMHYILEQRNQLLATTLQDLQDKEQQLARQQKHQALSHMAAGLLHEILNPVNNSIQALSFAQSLNRDQSLHEPIVDALENQNRIATIIQDLRAYIAEKPNRSKTENNLYEQLNKAKQICRTELDQIEVKMSGDSHLVIHCFPSELVQLFVNIILNAASAITKKFNGKTGGTLLIQWQQEGRNIKLSFLDNGLGIDPAVLPKVEDPFVGEESPQHLGLGLSICRTIVHHHGGHIRFFSEPAVSTRVEVVLPSNI